MSSFIKLLSYRRYLSYVILTAVLSTAVYFLVLQDPTEYIHVGKITPLFYSAMPVSFAQGVLGVEEYTLTRHVLLFFVSYATVGLVALAMIAPSIFLMIVSVASVKSIKLFKLYMAKSYVLLDFKLLTIFRTMKNTEKSELFYGLKENFAQSPLEYVHVEPLVAELNNPAEVADIFRRALEPRPSPSVSQGWFDSLQSILDALPAIGDKLTFEAGVAALAALLIVAVGIHWWIRPNSGGGPNVGTRPGDLALQDPDSIDHKFRALFARTEGLERSVEQLRELLEDQSNLLGAVSVCSGVNSAHLRALQPSVEANQLAGHILDGRLTAAENRLGQLTAGLGQGPLG